MSDIQEIQHDENQTPWWRRKHQLAGLALGIGVGTAVGASSSTLISGILVGVAITTTTTQLASVKSA